MRRESRKLDRSQLREEQGTSPVSTPNRFQMAPRRKSVMSSFEEEGSLDFVRKQSWLAQLAQRAATKAKLLYQAQVGEDFNSVTCVKYSPDGESFVVGYGSGAIQIRESTTGSVMTDVVKPSVVGFPVNCVRFLPPYPHFFAASSNGTISIYSGQAAPREFCTEQDNEINSIDINQSSDVLVSGGRDGVIRVYDVGSSKTIHSYGEGSEFDGGNDFHKMRIFCTKFYGVGRDIFMSGGWDDVVKVWDLRIKTGCIRNIVGPHICGDALDARAETILTGSWTVENSLQLWDLHSGKLIETIMPVNRPRTVDGEFIYCVQFFNGDPSGNAVLAGGSGTGALEVVNLHERKITTSFRINRAIQTIDSNKRSAVFGGADNVIRVANISL